MFLSFSVWRHAAHGCRTGGRGCSLMREYLCGSDAVVNLLFGRVTASARLSLASGDRRLVVSGLDLRDT